MFFRIQVKQCCCLQIKTVSPLCNYVYILLNNSLDNPFKNIASLSQDGLVLHNEEISEWLEFLLDDYL